MSPSRFTRFRNELLQGVVSPEFFDDVYSPRADRVSEDAAEAIGRLGGDNGTRLADRLRTIERRLTFDELRKNIAEMSAVQRATFVAEFLGTLGDAPPLTRYSSTS